MFKRQKPPKNENEKDKTIRRYKKEAEKIRNENKKLKEENRELKKENKEMKKKLDFYESCNMPSSVPSLKKEKKMLGKSKEQELAFKSKKQRKKTGPRGVRGHRGNTKILGEPDYIIENNICSCPHCKSNNVEKTDKTKGKKVEDTVVVETTKVTKFIKRECKCLDCGETFYSRHPECPIKGNIGINTMAQVTVNRFMGRGSLGICKLLAYTFTKFKMSRETVNNIINRTVPSIENEYGKIVKKTQNGFVRYADETGHNLNGGKVWLWVSVVSDAVLFMFGDRGKNTARKILGTPEDLKIVSRDGWRAYCNLGFLTQRCWDHLKRYVEVKDKNDSDSVNFEKTIMKFYKDIRNYKKNPPTELEKRIEEYNKYIDRFYLIIEKFKGIKSVERQLKHFSNGGVDWFTCVLYPEVEMSNNTAELYIRDPILDRKISYCFRNENNMNNYAKIKSVVMTWRKNGYNVYDKLIETFRNYNANGIG
jgi:hypothetical protein